MTCDSSLTSKITVASIANNGHAVIAFAGQPPDQRAIAIGNIGDFEAVAGKFENPPLHNAERAPGKLNQLNHAANAIATTNYSHASME